MLFKRLSSLMSKFGQFEHEKSNETDKLGRKKYILIIKILTQVANLCGLAVFITLICTYATYDIINVTTIA